MAVLVTNNVRCKNKLCNYEGTVTSFDHNEPSLVCPKCGFKTLAIYSPYMEKLARDIKQATEDAKHSTLKFP